MPDSLLIPASATIIILEGNYLLLNQDLWRDIAPLMDFRVFVDADLDATRLRVARRHVQAGIEPDMKSALRRVDANDGINARLVKEELVASVDLIVKSVEDSQGLGSHRR
jgi:pantothenate kinase